MNVKTISAGSILTILSIAVAWQTLGWPLPSSKQALASVREDVREIAAETSGVKLLVLYAHRRDLRRRLKVAEEKENHDLAEELKDQIEIINRVIAKEKKKGE